MSAFSKYGGWNAEDADKERKEQEGKKSGGSSFLSLKPDTSKILRPVPSKDGGSPFYTFWKHTYRDPQTGKLISYPCPSRNDTHQDCPDCRRASNLINSAAEVDKKQGYGMRAKPRAMLNVFVRPSEEEIQNAADDGEPPPRGKVFVWEFSSWVGKERANNKSMHSRLLDLLENKRRGGNFVDPGPDGCDIMLTRNGEGLDTSYDLDVLNRDDEKRVLIAEEEFEKLVEEEAYDLRGFATPPNPEQLNKILQGEAGRPSGGPRNSASSNRALPPRQPKSSRTAGDMVEEDYGEGGGSGDASF